MFNVIAIRSGDYYMFDELDDDDLDIIEEPRQTFLDDLEEEEKDKHRTITQVKNRRKPPRIIAANRLKLDEFGFIVLKHSAKSRHDHGGKERPKKGQFADRRPGAVWKIPIISSLICSPRCECY